MPLSHAKVAKFAAEADGGTETSPAKLALSPVEPSSPQSPRDIESGSATPRAVGPGGTPLSRKIDADELLITWMMGWHGWVDEVMKPGYQPEM